MTTHVAASLDMGRFRWSWVAAVVCTLIVSVLVITPHGPAGAADGSISGTVTGAGSGPLQDVDVFACDSLGDCYLGVTGADGSYSVSVPPGSYFVEFLPALPFLAEFYDDTTFETATPVVVVDGENTGGIDAELGVGGSVSGTVVAEGGDPLGDVYVEACTFDFIFCGGSFTGPDGGYSIMGLRTGDYVVEFRPDSGYVGEFYDNAPRRDQATAVPVVAGVGTAPIDAELGVGGSVSGTVVAEGGDPLGDVYVEACTDDLNFCEGSFTGPDGGYSIMGLRTGDYVVEFRPDSRYLGEFYDNAPTRDQATAVPVVAGVDTAPIDAELLPDVCADPTRAFADSTLVVGFEWIACPSGAASQVLDTSPTSLMTFDADGGLLMTTGRAADAFGPNDGPATSTSFSAPPFRGANDVSLLRLDLDIPVGAQCLSFDFVFGSEEYPEFVGSSFNDAFIAELGASTWTIDASTITAPMNFAFDRAGNEVSVNSSFFDAVVVDAGWEYDGSTPKLAASTPIGPGPTSLFLTIFDAGDSALDSAVVIDALRISPDICTAGASAGGVWPDFDGDGLADRSVFRPEFGGWFADGQATQFLGLSGDVPVPGDYDGDDVTERAVFRDGAWFIEGEATRFLGTGTDVPVPGDYDGDGDWEPAVYRDGAWFIEGQPTRFLGAAGDVPVPGDYNGDGVTEIAVFRPSVGGWYVDGAAPVFFGLATDVPVPGDYNGDGTTDRAVFRPEFGGWYVDGQATEFIGLSTDVPVPADYNGDGTTERAVFRPEFGGWYVQGAVTVFYGLGTDIPLPLPAAVYNRYY